LGIVLYEMLVGTSPFDDPSPMGLMLQVVEQPVPDVQKLNPQVDKPLADILARMTEKDPANRYQTCHQLTDDLKRYLTGKPLKASEGSATAAPPAASEPAKPRRWPLLLLLLVVGGAGAAWWWGPALWSSENTELSVDTDAFPMAEELAQTEAVESEATDVEVREGAVVGQPQNPAAMDAGGVDNLQPSNLVSESAGDTVAVMDNDFADAGQGVVAKAGGNDLAARPAEVEALVDPPVVISAPTHAVVLAEGDPALTGQIRELIYAALKDGGHPQREPGFVPGINRVIQGRQLDIAAIREDALATGVRYLVLASAEVLDVGLLEFYGQRDTYYTTRIELTLLDLQSRETLGTWGEQVQYTNINAHIKAEQVVVPMVRELVEALR
ncbi:MAG TPA: hypothetical protein VIC08_10480, partial [Cellvibrionaceae bacterium]